MNKIQFYKNKKIYVCLLGILMATFVYLKMNIDFSFYEIDYEMKSFLNLWIIYVIKDIKIWCIIFLLRKLKHKVIIQAGLLLCLGYLLGATIVISTMYVNTMMIPRVAFCFFTYLFISHLFEKEWKTTHGLYYLILFLLSTFFQVFLKIIF